MTSEHITALMCIRADGQCMPSMVVFRNALPKTNYAAIGPDDALYRASESGYVNSVLYKQYVVHLNRFIPGMYYTLSCNDLLRHL
jgi:hypothetical protein